MARLPLEVTDGLTHTVIAPKRDKKLEACVWAELVYISEYVSSVPVGICCVTVKPMEH